MKTKNAGKPHTESEAISSLAVAARSTPLAGMVRELVERIKELEQRLPGKSV